MQPFSHTELHVKSVDCPFNKCLNLHVGHSCDVAVFCVLSGCVGRKPPHVQETQVEAGWSREASAVFWSRTDKCWKLVKI